MQAKEKPECMFTCIRKNVTRTWILNNGYSHLVAAEGPRETQHEVTLAVCVASIKR